MKIKYLAVILFVVAFLGCKNNKKSETEKPQVMNNSFKLSLNALVLNDDSFHVYYTEDGSINFTEENSIWKEFKGNSNPQQIEFSLPEDVYPTQLRIDFGLNKDQQDIKLESIVLEYKGNKKVISGFETGNFFIADASKCTFDPSTGVIKAILKEGVRQSPSLYPQEINLKPLLENFGKK